MSHVLRVQRLGLVGVVGAFDDRPAVGEDGELVIVHVELEQELVEADLAQGRQLAGHPVEIEFAGDAVTDRIPAVIYDIPFVSFWLSRTSFWGCGRFAFIANVPREKYFTPLPFRILFFYEDFHFVVLLTSVEPCAA